MNRQLIAPDVAMVTKVVSLAAELESCCCLFLNPLASQS